MERMQELYKKVYSNDITPIETKKFIDENMNKE